MAVCGKNMYQKAVLLMEIVKFRSDRQAQDTMLQVRVVFLTINKNSMHLLLEIVDLR